MQVSFAQVEELLIDLLQRTKADVRTFQVDHDFLADKLFEHGSLSGVRFGTDPSSSIIAALVDEGIE